MATSIEAYELKVNDLFGPKYRFTIPEYQRQYSWLKEHAEQLFDDIAEEAFSSSISISEMKPYFVGSMVIVQAPDAVDASVIDGQQRLTTLTILLAAIRDVSAAKKIIVDEIDFAQSIGSYIFQPGNPAGGIKASFQLHIRPADKDFFQKYIQHPDGLNKLNPNEVLTDSQKRIALSGRTFMEKLVGLSPDKITRLGMYILQKVAVAVVVTSDEETAFRIFSVLNDRGLDLSPADILKAEVIGSLPVKDRAVYAQKWEDREKDLGTDAFSELFAHIRMIGVKRKSKESTVKEIRETLKPAKNAAYFVDHMVVPYADSMLELRNEEIELADKVTEVADIVTWLNQIPSIPYVGHSDWVPVALILVQKLRNKPSELFAALSKLEAITLGMLVLHNGAAKRIERFGKVLQELEAGNTAPSLELTADEKKGILERLSENLYDEYHCRYVLKRLDQHYAGAGARYKGKNITVEHILPQNPAEKSQWLKDFPTEADREKVVNRLGNLTLLTGNRNSSLGNSDFSNKVEKYFKKKQGLFALTTDIIAKYKTWTAKDFKKRHQELIAACKEIWGL